MALACYLSAVVAIGNCMADACPSVGTMYRERLLKLPRRLGFDATPAALRQSREVVETDLLEFASATRAWISTGTNHAGKLLDHLRAMEETLIASADLQRAFLDEMAEHIQASAEVDDEGRLRQSFKRYASGLSSYANRMQAEKVAITDEFRRRREDIEDWLAEAKVSDFSDPETGLLNRAAAQRRLQTAVLKQKPFCAIVVGWSSEDLKDEASRQSLAGQITRELGERLASTIRPYDIVFRWSEDQVLTIFDAAGSGIGSRAQQISGWLGDAACSVNLRGQAVVVKTRTKVTVVDYAAEEPVAAFIERIDAVAR
jgi:GGDEF domain-containing protein